MALEGIDEKLAEQIAKLRSLGVLKYTDSSGRTVELTKLPETKPEDRKK